MRILRRLLPTGSRDGTTDGPANIADPERRLTSGNSDSGRVIAEAEAQSAAGLHAAALVTVARALAVTRDDPKLLLARASILFAWSRYREARAEYVRVEELDPRRRNGLLQMAWTCFYTGDLQGAETRMRELTISQPSAAEGHFGLGVLLQAQRRLVDAVASYEHALELSPESVDCLMHLASCRIADNNLSGAEALLRHAVAVDGDRANAWSHLGTTLGRLDRDHDALEAFQHAARLELARGESVDSFINLAINARDGGRLQEALELYERNLAQRPSTDGHFSYAVALLTAGRLLDGWRQFEFRWLRDPSLSSRPRFGKPVWAGQALRGKTILLRAEQGMGDAIQFIRYASQLKALGATVRAGVFAGLEELMRTMSDVDQVHGPNDLAPDIDFYIHMMSLPRVFGTDLGSIPAEIPYLHADPARSERWAQRLGKDRRRTVGIVWAGSPSHVRDRYRSLSLRELAPLGEIKGVRWVSLQKGEGAREAEAPPPGMELMNLGPELEDFADTAALISQVDLVLCVDTAVAHLAGALGKLVWVMLPSPADWRWLEGRDDSPWYPTMRLFRQSRRGEWDDVIERVKAALQERLRDGASATTPSADRPVAMVPVPQPPVVAIPSQAPGHRPGFSAVAECRYGILQYLPDEGLIGDSLGWYGEYLQPQLDLLARLIRPGATILEVGAGVGEHALCLAAAVGEAGHLFLYESRPVVKRILQQNLGANRVTNVTLMRRTLGATGEATDHGSETLDELQLERLDWLKINGSVTALDILDGGTETLWRLRPLLFLATADEPALTSLASRVKEFSYRCWRMDTALFNPQNFNRRDTDIFSGRTALALLAIPEEIEVDMALDECVEIS
jgi:tetratricopeptide (TPR) repeat protein/precorrin-6B methylase 2